MCSDNDNDIFVRKAAFEDGRQQVVDEVLDLFENCTGDLQADIERFLTSNGAI